MTPSVETTVVECLARHTGSSGAGSIGKDTALRADLDLDSLRFLVVLLEICQTLQVEVESLDTAQLGSMRTVGELVSLLESGMART